LLLSTTADLPSGPTIVWVLVVIAVVVEALSRRRSAHGTALKVPRHT
jgi:ABC-type Mn2+/Zn2+ transport system permease subunit